MPNFSELLTGGDMTLASILWPMTLGVIIATCVVFFNKQTLGKLVQRLLEDKIDSEYAAKSLRELGIKENIFLRMALKPGTTFRKMVMVAPPREKDPDAEDGETPDPDTPSAPEEDRYYIPEDKAYRAEVTYTPDGSSVLTLVIVAVIFTAVTVILLSVIPKIVEMLGG